MPAKVGCFFCRLNDRQKAKATAFMSQGLPPAVVRRGRWPAVVGNFMAKRPRVWSVPNPRKGGGCARFVRAMPVSSHLLKMVDGFRQGPLDCAVHVKIAGPQTFALVLFAFYRVFTARSAQQRFS